MKIYAHTHLQRNMSEEQMLDARNLSMSRVSSLSLPLHTNEPLLIKEENGKEKNTQQCNKGFDNPVFLIEDAGVNYKKGTNTLFEEAATKQMPDDFCRKLDEKFIPVSHEFEINKLDQQEKQQQLSM